MEQKYKAMDMLTNLEEHYQENFYAMDIETTGMKHKHPIQIAIVLFIEGKPFKWFNEYYQPEVKIQPRAKLIHGLT